jgi:hypothetical protein
VRLFGKKKTDEAPAAPAGQTPSSPASKPAAGGAATPIASPDAQARRLDMRGLRSLVADEDELRKGTEVFDRGGLAHLARYGERIFCEAAGSGASPYRVTIALPTSGETKARCTCMAARSRPVCKHAAALLVAWSRAPESFLVSDAPPVVAEGGAKRAAVKTGRVKTETLMGRGVEQTLALVRELAVAGVATAGRDRPQQIRTLAETLRANRLRRLSARVVELADLLEAGTRRRGSLVPLDYANVVGDLLLTARRVERHLAGETLEDRYLEELVGRNWQKADRRPQAGLNLIEYAYLVRETADDFVIRERRLLDLTSGTHYCEKQILPAFLARRTPPPQSQPGIRATGTGGVYPGFAPHRLDTDGVASAGPLAGADLDRIVELALPDPAAALAAFQEQGRDVFAPDRLPVAVRTDAIAVIGDHLAVLGSGGEALLLAPGGVILDALAGDRLATVIGDIALDGILAILHPLAVVTAGLRPALRPVVAGPDSHADDAAATTRDWLESARASGASSAALSLAEVRDELAAVLVNGLGSLTERVAGPLATRLADLGLERPSALLREMAARPDPADRLEDLVRLQQVLGIGAVRLAGTRSVPRAELIEVPGQPTLLIPDPGPTLSPAEVRRRRAAGTMNAYEAAVHEDRFIRNLPPSAFFQVVPWWATASYARAVAGALADQPQPPFGQIAEALSLKYGLTAALTAVHVLEGMADRRAEDQLRQAAALRDPKRQPYVSDHGYVPTRAVRAAAAAALRTRAIRDSWLRNASDGDPKVVPALLQDLVGAGRKERRAEAAQKLAEQDSLAVLPGLRRAWRTDVLFVREAAAEAMTSLGDVSMVEEFMNVLIARARQDELAKFAAYALGGLGDMRGIAVLLDALAEGWKSNLVIEALAGAGQAAVASVIERMLEDPDLSSRRGFVSALESHPAPAVQEALVGALDSLTGGTGSLPNDPEVIEKAAALLRLSASHKSANQDMARRIVAMRLGDSRGEKALLRAAEKVLAPKPPAKPS